MCKFSVPRVYQNQDIPRHLAYLQTVLHRCEHNIHPRLCEPSTASWPLARQSARPRSLIEEQPPAGVTIAEPIACSTRARTRQNSEFRKRPLYQPSLLARVVLRFEKGRWIGGDKGGFRVWYLHFHLLLGGAVAMAANGNHRPELLQIVSLRRVLRARAVVRHCTRASHSSGLQYIPTSIKHDQTMLNQQMAW